MSDIKTNDLPRIQELARFSMFADNGTGSSRARLAWSIRDANPRISVYTNDPNDKTDYGIISAPLNPETFFMFVSLFEKACLSNAPVGYKIENYRGVYENDKLTDKKVHVSDLVFGKDNEGIMYLSVVANNRPKVKFVFTLSDYHKIVRSDGESISNSEMSVLLARSTINALRDIYIGLTNGFRVNKNAPATMNKSNGQSSTGNVKFDDMPF